MEIENQLQSLGYEVTSIVDTGKKQSRKPRNTEFIKFLQSIFLKMEK